MLVDELVRSTAAVAGGGLHVAACHAAAEDDARQVLERVQSRADVVEGFVTEATPAIGANTGPGLVGLAWFVD